MILFWFFTEARKPSFLRSSASKEIVVLHHFFLRINSCGKTCDMERSNSISELSAENGVAVANAYGLIIGDNEDHIDNRTTDVC